MIEFTLHNAVMVLHFLVHRSMTVKGLTNVLIYTSPLRSCTNCRLTAQNRLLGYTKASSKTVESREKSML